MKTELQKVPPRVDSLSLPFLLDKCERDLKQESRRNKKLRFRKFDERHLAEKWIPPCSA
jgi:hypothetical protein